MIEVIVSNACHHCDEQKEIMERYFFDDEFKLIDASSDEFRQHELHSEINSVPFIVVRGKNGNIIHAKTGVHSEDVLKKLMER